MDKLEEIQKRMDDLEKRIKTLEGIINGSSNRRPGRKPLLSAEEKRAVIQKHENGISCSKLAEEYGVCKSTICRICKGQKNDEGMVIDVTTIGRRKKGGSQEPPK